MHGDLHYKNVILANRGPQLIDPKALPANPAFELTTSLLKTGRRLRVPDFLAHIKQHAAIMADETGIDYTRIIQWAAVTLAHTVFYRGLKQPKHKTQLPHVTALLALSSQD